MKDKQVYRNLQKVTQEDLEQVKRNFEWVAEQLDYLLPEPRSLVINEHFKNCITISNNYYLNIQVVILMGSSSDTDHCLKIKKNLKDLGVPTEIRVTSAHKGTEETLAIAAEYEGDYTN